MSDMGPNDKWEQCSKCGTWELAPLANFHSIEDCLKEQLSNALEERDTLTLALAEFREKAVATCMGTGEEGESPDCWDWHSKDYAAAIRALPSPSRERGEELLKELERLRKMYAEAVKIQGDEEVLRYVTSGNAIPVTRCTVSADLIRQLVERRK